MGRLEVTNCDLKIVGRSPLSTLRLYGAGRCDAVLGAQEQESRALVNVEIMRAFVRLRRVLASHDELKQKLEQLEGKYDVQFKVVFDAIRTLMDADVKPRRRIGFKSDE